MPIGGLVITLRPGTGLGVIAPPFTPGEPEGGLVPAVLDTPCPRSFDDAIARLRSEPGVLDVAIAYVSLEAQPEEGT